MLKVLGNQDKSFFTCDLEPVLFFRVSNSQEVSNVISRHYGKTLCKMLILNKFWLGGKDTIVSSKIPLVSKSV